MNKHRLAGCEGTGGATSLGGVARPGSFPDQLPLEVGKAPSTGNCNLPPGAVVSNPSVSETEADAALAEGRHNLDQVLDGAASRC
jgi:hypothetical protein